jgi:hypothetical protein
MGATGATGAQGPAGPSGTPGGGTNRVYRWAVFSTYDQPSGWILNNNADFFGGIEPDNWTDGGAIASQMSADKDVLRTLFVHKGYVGNNALIWNENWKNFSSTNGTVVTALFRVRNATVDPIIWNVRFHYTCFGNWSEFASAALNGVSVFSTTMGTICTNNSFVNLAISVPGSQTSTAIFVSTSNQPSGDTRTATMAFSNNTFVMPAGLELVDDFETATGGWEQ